MVRKSAENGSASASVPPFLKKCYQMVDDESTDSVISWSQNNDSFVIWDMTQFSVGLLPKYFKHNNFSSFIRQLNIYGFRKVDTDRWEFANEGFIKGQKHLLKNISRRKHTPGADQQKGSNQQDKSDEQTEGVANFGLWNEVENLKADRNALTQELVKLSQHQESAENKLLLLRNRLQGMEKNQQQMLSFLVMAMQSPGILVQLLQPKENNWRMSEAGIMLEQDNRANETVVSDGMIVTYKPPVSEAAKPVQTPHAGSEEQHNSDSSADGLKDFFINSEFLEVLMDEKLSPLDNHSPFILPDLPDDGAWEQLLLDSPFLEKGEDSVLEGEVPIDNGMEMEPIIPETPIKKSQDFELLVAQLENTQNFGVDSAISEDDLENSQSLEFLTEQMGLLVSEPIPQ
ncbi:Heat shock transcription factor [Quillaja saponaria]|uniref:Heat shock transcription factor n=1 Tax=Quillaja saponaria TaxID=32244 RepID=A0AAD7PGU7_QUISA|nr:Heat shock transcription factor [Quillaja saponaria]